jgi:heptosyltransferase-2
VVAPSWIGDAVLAQPLLRLLKAADAGAAIDVLSSPWTAAVFRRMGEVNQAIEHPFTHGKLALSGRWKLARSLARTRYDHALVLPNSLKSALLPAFAGIPLRSGYVGELRYGLLNDARSLDKEALPLMVERFAALGLAPGLPLPRPLPAPCLRVSPADQERVADALALDRTRPVACFCVGAEFGPAKRWPAAYFSQLAKLMAAQGHQVWLMGSGKDKAIGDGIAKESPVINLCGRTTLDEAIVLLSAAAVVVSNDSGLMHVAAALDRPMVTLFGSSSPRFTPPLSERARVLSLGLPCSPCFKRDCPLGHFKCMMELSPERVLAEIHSMGPRN